MAWFTLLAAGILEIAFAFSLKPSEGFTRLVPSLAVYEAAAGPVGGDGW
jgi:quaternary ammonium compound-resistance protein SugE